MNKIKLGNFLADLRNEKGLTQEQLAEMINVNYKTISKWECGNSTPSLETLTELSEIFEVSLYELSNCERINNPFISKENIKKVINKDNIKRFFIIKLIILIISLILLAFITYSCIYTINNYNQFQVYELVSEDETIDVKGYYFKTKQVKYLTINYFANHNSNESFMNSTITSLHYSIIIDNIETNKNELTFDRETTIEDAFSQLKLHLSINESYNDIKEIILKIEFEIDNKGIMSKSFKINISKQISNDKLFY